MSEQKNAIQLLFELGNLVGTIIVLNLLFLIFSIPIITVGPALCGLYKAFLKLIRDEGNPIRDFINGFKSDFKTSLFAWVIIAVLCAGLWGNYVFLNATDNLNGTVFIIMAIIAFWIAALLIYTFPLIAQFENTLPKTLRNAVLLSITNFPKTVLFIILHGIFPALFFFNSDAFIRLLPFFIAFGISLPAYLCAILLNKIFKPFMEAQ